MKKTLKILFVISPSLAFAQMLCPKTINTTQVYVSGVDVRFEVFQSQAPVKLKDINFYNGHPSEMAMQMFDQEINHDKQTEWIWKFATGIEWYYACVYSNTSIQLVRKLPDFYECVVHVDRTRSLYGSPSILQVECKERKQEH